MPGLGTIGIEVLEQVPDLDAIIVPVGGAGLIAGVGMAIKTLRPDVDVIGVEPANVASFAAALKAGYPVDGFKEGTIADGLAVPIVGPNAFKIAQRYTDENTSVSEKAIALAILRLIEMEKIVVEGGGAASVAALLPGGPLYGKYRGKKVVCILGGGNIDTTLLGRVIERGLAADDRLVRFTVVVSDRPGGIANLSKVFYECGASIKDIYHERAWLHTKIDQVMVKCVVETTDKEHTERMFKSLMEKNYVYIREHDKADA